MLNRRIKRLLNDIIDVAYAPESKEARRRYKSFTIRFLVKENSRSSGVYHCKKHLIEVYNPSLGAHHTAKCCLHELSHHIDYVKNGKTGHQKPFYAEYARLIYASLDMGILEKKDFYDNWSSDRNKVWKIINEYRPHPVAYKAEETPVISVYNAYAIKGELKAEEYLWNKIEQTWEKEVDENDIEPAVNKLKELGAVSAEEKNDPKQLYFSIRQPGMTIEAIVYIEAAGKTYEKREQLKNNGFHFNKDKKKWLRKVPASDGNELLNRLNEDPDLSGCKFNILKRKD